MKESLNDKIYYDLSDILLDLNDIGYKTEVRMIDGSELKLIVNNLNRMTDLTFLKFISEINEYYCDIYELFIITIVKPRKNSLTTNYFFDDQEKYDIFNETVDRIKKYMNSLGH